MASKSLTLSQRIYLLLTLVVSVPMLLFGFRGIYTTREQLLAVEERNLMQIVASLEQRLPGSFERIIAEAGLAKASPEERRRELNRRLQPIIQEMAREWPRYGMGYYSRELKILAVEPFQESLIGHEASTDALEIYASGKTKLSYIEDGFTQGGPILAEQYPLYIKGSLVGHVWANSRLADLEGAVSAAIWRQVILTFMVWLAMVLVIRASMHRMERSLADMVTQIAGGRSDQNLLRDYPELAPILEKVRQLEGRLKAEFAAKEKLHLEMAKLDRLNAVGEMAAGVAHEIRNPMTVIMGFIQMMMKKADPKGQENFALIIVELKRMEEIIDDFLSLAKNRPVERAVVDINASLRGLCPLLLAEGQKRGVEVVLDMGDKLPRICADVREMRQLILNLARNGMEAIEGKGVVTIATRFGAGAIQIVVSDTGCGIPGDVLEKIYSPFFTTKAEGTGLGLAVCRGIVERHGGWIDVLSRTGEGTQFIVYLPKAGEC